MKKIYVAGAYSADNVIDVLKNIGRGEAYSSAIFHLGYAPFCPWHDKDFVLRGWDRKFTVEMFYEYSIEWLKVCDAMFCVPGWEGSKGTLAEREIAMGLPIPIFYDLDTMKKELV